MSLAKLTLVMIGVLLLNGAVGEEHKIVLKWLLWSQIMKLATSNVAFLI